MKLLFLMLFFISSVSAQPDLVQLRTDYPKAVSSEELTLKLYKNLSGVTKTDSKTLLVYKGAVLTLMAKFSKSKKDKKEFFKEGVSLIESAAKAEPSNIEIRYIRMSVQENSPKFLGYHKNIEEDKKFILENYKTTNSKIEKMLVKAFVLQSEIFEVSEKAIFN